ncbi:hypothetical protein BDW62DRAFT_199669 [Aspergillus aurantiobrunneus]
MPCNVINNPDFEAGLQGWRTNPPDIAQIDGSAGNRTLMLPAYADPEMLELYQELSDLDTEKSYGFLAPVQVGGYIPEAGECNVTVTAVDDPSTKAIATGTFGYGQKGVLTDAYKPNVRDTTLDIAVSCTGGDESLVEVYFDNFILSDC